MDLFDPQDGSKRPNPSVEKTINTLVDREVADIRKMRRSGDFVLKNLRRFEAWTVDDESAVKRKDFSWKRTGGPSRFLLSKMDPEDLADLILQDILRSGRRKSRNWNSSPPLRKWYGSLSLRHSNPHCHSMTVNSWTRKDPLRDGIHNS